jgi:hypothetical protein
MKQIPTPFVIKRHEADSVEFSEILKSDLRLVYGAEGDGGPVYKEPTITVICPRDNPDAPCYTRDDCPPPN